ARHALSAPRSTIPNRYITDRSFRPTLEPFNGSAPATTGSPSAISSCKSDMTSNMSRTINSALLCVLCGLFFSVAGRADEKKPNILFLFADDFCYEALGYLGHDIETPNLDRLAKRGTTFTHAYNMGSFSGAVCVASRGQLISGRSVWRTNAIYNTMDKERDAG